MNEVEIFSWREGLKKISLTKLIRSKTGLGLSEAKAQVDSLLKGNVVLLVINADETTDFMDEADLLGANCRIKVNKNHS